MDDNKKIEIEAELIQLSVYYMIYNNGIDEKYTLRDCAKILKEEMEKINTKETLFSVSK